MLRAMKLLALLVLCAIFVVNSTALHSAYGSPIETPPWAWRKGSFGISGSTEYFWTHANYGPARGEYSRLTGDNNLTDFQTWVRARYAFWSKFSVYGGAGLTQVRVLDAFNEKTNNGLSDAFVGGHFVVWREWLRMVAEIEAGMPISSITRYQISPLVNDGAMYGRALLHLRKDIGALKIFGYVGARLPTEGLAKTLHYGAFAEVPLGKIMLGGGVDGIETLLNDDLTLAERSLTTGSANGGSYRYRTFDPALLRARGWIGFKPGNTVEIRAGYDKTLTGLRTAEGQAITLNVVFSSIPRRTRATGISENPDERISAPGTTDSFKLDSEQTDPDVIKPGNDFQPGTSGGDLNETERLLDGK